MTAPVILVVTGDIAAPPETVFDAWLDPAIAGRFLFATPDGEMITVEIDPRVGGRALIVERRPGGDAHHHLLFDEIDRPRRLRFHFRADPAKEGEWTRVTLDLAALGDGTRLTLTHEMDPAWAVYEQQTRKGWTTILASLATVLEKDNG
jgi:uncharacterized protein YndB with AHSA1/START domain